METMSDHRETDGESAMQRALRMKKAALQAPKRPGGELKRRQASAGIPAGQSKPWMKR